MIDLEYLFRRYARTGDEDVRNQLVNAIITTHFNGDDRSLAYDRLHNLDKAIASYGTSGCARS